MTSQRQEQMLKYDKLIYFNKIYSKKQAFVDDSFLWSGSTDRWLVATVSTSIQKYCCAIILSIYSTSEAFCISTVIAVLWQHNQHSDLKLNCES